MELDRAWMDTGYGDVDDFLLEVVAQVLDYDAGADVDLAE